MRGAVGALATVSSLTLSKTSDASGSLVNSKEIVSKVLVCNVSGLCP